MKLSVHFARNVLATSLLLLLPLAGYAHLVNPTLVHIRGLGQTGVFTVVDQGDCSALISTSSANTAVATVTPELIDAVSHTFTVTAGTNASALEAAGYSTIITVKWVGEHVGGAGPCQDISSSIVEVIIEDPAVTRANTSQSGSTDEPISSYTGELYNQFKTDLRREGPLPLSFSRYYGSRLVSEGLSSGFIGDNWRHNFEWELRYYGNSIEIVGNQGQVLTFIDSDSGLSEGSWELQGIQPIRYQLVRDGGEFVLANPLTQRIYAFENVATSGQVAHLTGIEDGKGNRLSLIYTGDQLTQVNDGLGRIFTFSYTGGQLTTVSDGSRSISFEYDGNSLVRFIDSLGQVTEYGYDISHSLNGLLTEITLPQGTIDRHHRIMTTWGALANNAMGLLMRSHSPMTLMSPPLPMPRATR